MTLDELQSELDVARAHGAKGDEQILLGIQPDYPYGAKVSKVCFDQSCNIADSGAIVLCQGTWLGYGERDWWLGEPILTA